jgi:sugar lactone lactonase YvrE
MNVIYAYDYDIETGAATNRRVHIDTSSLAHGDFSLPDGLCIDSEGGIWSARYVYSFQGSRLWLFSPATTNAI